MTEIIQIGFERTPLTEQHIRDAKNADDWPGDEMHEVTIEPGEITLEGTPRAWRWLYDYLHYLKRAWRMDGEQTDANAAEGMAEAIWEFAGDELPEQQRNRRIH